MLPVYLVLLTLLSAIGECTPDGIMYDQSLITRMLSADHVPVMKWDTTDPDFKQYLIDNNRPVFLTGAFDEWPALTLWKDFLLFKEQLSPYDVRAIWTGDESLFFINNTNGVEHEEMQEWLRRPWSGSKRLVDMTMGELVMAVNAKGPPYFYFSDGAQEWLGPLNAHVEPSERFNVESSLVTSIWFGGAGVTAQTHFDSNANFFAQIQGRKRFTLFPPEDTQHLHIYPCSHPGYTQSQVPLGVPLDMERFPGFLNARPLQVTVGPGEMLFIPPYWYHRVETLEPSISLSQHNYPLQLTEMKEVVGEAFGVPLPFEGDWSDHLLKAVLAKFVVEVAEELGGATFVRDVYMQRFRPLYLDVEEEMAEEAKSFCPPAAAHQEAAGVDISGRAQLIADKLRVGGTGLQVLHTGNYVEEVVKFSLGLHRVPIFLRYCV